jgi:hypothetical protein
LNDTYEPGQANRLARLSFRTMIRALLALALLPNLVIGFVALAAHTPRPLVNLDYFAVLLLHRFVSRAVLVLLLTVSLLIDVAFTIAPAFNFGPSEVVQAVAEIRHLSARAIVLAMALVTLVTLMALGFIKLRGGRSEAGNRSRQLAACGAFLIAIIALDVLNGSHAITWRLRPLVDVDVSASMFASRYAARGTMPPSGRIPAETDGLREAIARASTTGSWDGPNKIVVVIVESMGRPRFAEASAMFAPLMTDSMALRFRMRTGVVSAFGSTTTGELRALCGMALNHFAVIGSNLACLPTQLRALGFDAVALHGYNGSLFQRREWYPSIGFSRMRFQEELQAGTRHPECGTVFHGICDSSMIAVVREELTRSPEKRELIYWLTLSSHFPIDPRNAPSGPACQALGRIGREREVCSLWSAIWPVLEGVARLASDRSLPPAWYIVSGDHAPPQLFSDTTLFIQRRVPFIELRPLVR